MFFSTLWPDELPLIGACVAAAMYWLGTRRHRTAAWRDATTPARRSRERWRATAFVAALVTIALALGEPVDGLADRLFWMHMVQHVLLLSVAAPLLVLASPWTAIWRAFPLGLRRPLARTLARRRWAAPLRGLAGALAIPAVAFLVLNADVLAWHLPAAYDLTLRNNAVHYAEHASFLLLGVIGWAQVIGEEPPLRSRLPYPHRVAFALGTMITGWLLALALAFARTPWYAPYAQLRHRPGGISALADQHLAAGVMWVPASIPWALAIFVLIYHWVLDREQAGSRRPTGESASAPVHTTRRIHA